MVVSECKENIRDSVHRMREAELRALAKGREGAARLALGVVVSTLVGDSSQCLRRSGLLLVSPGSTPIPSLSFNGVDLPGTRPRPRELLPSTTAGLASSFAPFSTNFMLEVHNTGACNFSPLPFLSASRRSTQLRPRLGTVKK